MATVREILATKGAEVYTVAPATTVLDATKKMNDHKIGAMPVVEKESIIGMFTERDVLRRVVAEQLAPGEVAVKDVMSTRVIYCKPTAPIDEVSRIMKDHRVRHLPVCGDDGKLLGLISIGDVNAYHASDTEATIHFLEEYIHGRV